ncbi:MAG: hypothetical protein ACREFE_12645 [Limisphaerales bacterium]
MKRQIKRRAADILSGEPPEILPDASVGWKPRARLWIAAFVLAANFVAGAQQTNHSAATDFSSFQIIPQRNIFNPDRYPRTMPKPHRHTSRGVPTFSLAGTMSYRKGMFAFFNGTSSDYRKALQQGGAIDGYMVTKITLDGVELQAAGKKIEMNVGAAMRQEGDGWQLSAPGEWSESPATETESANPSSENTPATNAGSSAEPNDVLKKMMQQREQELK